MEKAVIQTLKYFAYFDDYPPTADEIYVFLFKKLKKQQFTAILEKMTNQRLITAHKLSNNAFNDRKLPNCWQSVEEEKSIRYTLGEYSIKIKNQKSKIKDSNITIKQYSNYFKRYTTSKSKLNSLRFKLYIKLISIFPQIKLVGLSGTLAMMNAKDSDDIDLFIITAKNRLFTGRFIAVFLASLLQIRRIRLIRPVSSPISLIKNKLCLNLFFDEGSLAVPNHKKTPFVAHEILQMKPLVVKGDVYGQFLEANNWVFRLFPNARKDSHGFIADSHGYPRKSVIQNLWKSKIGGLIELCLKNLQLRLINKHKTSEIITARQLWFHPQDFGKKITTR